MTATRLPTSLVGSYPQPEWLIDRKRLAGRFPPRVRATELWRVAPEALEQAQDDATLLAIRAQERAGLDIITDGEMRRESYSNRFATALEGITGTTALHICFGYAAIIHERPNGHSFLPELCRCKVRQISIETAQSNPDTSVLKQLPEQTIILGVIDLADQRIEAAETVAARIRRALPRVDPARVIVAPDCGMKYLPREVADGKMRAMVEGAAIVRREIA